ISLARFNFASDNADRYRVLPIHQQRNLFRAVPYPPDRQDKIVLREIGIEKLRAPSVINDRTELWTHIIGPHRVQHELRGGDHDVSTGQSAGDDFAVPANPRCIFWLVTVNSYPPADHIAMGHHNSGDVDIKIPEAILI